MRKLTVLLSFAFISFIGSAAHAQVRDSIAVTRFVHSHQYVDDLGYYYCGSQVIATWPDVLGQFMDSTSYSMYHLFAEDQPNPYNPFTRGPLGQYVPNGWGQQLSDSKIDLSIPDGYYAHNPAFGGGAQGFSFEGCGQFRAATEAGIVNGPSWLNGGPFYVTDWWALYDIPDGTPIAAFEWEQTDALDVSFDGSFRGGRGSREIDASLPTQKKPVQEYLWDFGDQEASTAASPTHAYDEPGFYTVSLEVTDDDGETNTLTRTIEVKGVILQYYVIADPTVRPGDSVHVTVVVTNKGLFNAASVSITPSFGFKPDYLGYDPPPVSHDAFRGAAKNPSDPVTFTDLGPQQTETLQQVYPIIKVAETKIDNVWTAIPVVWTAVVPGISGVDDAGNPAAVKDVSEIVGSHKTRIENGTLMVEAVATRIDGEATQVHSGLDRWISSLYPNGVFYHVVPPFASDAKCNSGCVDLEMTVSEPDGTPVKNAVVELSRVLLDSDPANGSNVTPDQGGGVFCNDTKCGKTLELAPTGADGKVKARFWTPGVVKPVDAYLTAKAKRVGYSDAVSEERVIAIVPTEIDFVKKVATPTESDMLAIAIARSVEFATELPNMSKNCTRLVSWAAEVDAKTASIKIDGIWKKVLAKAIPYACGQVLSKYWYDEEFALEDEVKLRKDKETIIDSFNALVGVIGVYWFQSQFEFSLAGTGTTGLSTSFPFFKHTSEFVDVIKAATYDITKQYYFGGSSTPPTIYFDLHEVSHRKESGAYVEALHFALRTTPDIAPKVAVKKLISKDYDKSIFLTQERSEATTSGPTSVDDTSIDLAPSSGKNSVEDDSTFSAGYVVMIDPGLPTQELAQITSIVGSTASLSLPLRYSHAAGARVAYTDSLAIGPPEPPFSTTGLTGIPGASLTPTLSWHSFEPTSGYIVEIGTDTLFQNIVQTRDDLVDPSVELETLEDRTRYFWRVAAVNASGQGEWSERYSFFTGRPFGDDLSEAHSITDDLGAIRFAWHFGATSETGEELSSCGSGANSIWYKWTPATSGIVAFETFGSGYDTELSVWTGSNYPLTEVACNNDYDNGDHPTVQQSYVSFDAVAGTTYYVRVTGAEGAEGALLLTLRAPTTVAIGETDVSAPAAFKVSAFPNPVTDVATLVVDQVEAGPLHVSVYDVLGRRQMVVVDGTYPAGAHHFRFDPIRLPAGMYFVRADAGAQRSTVSLTVMR